MTPEVASDHSEVLKGVLKCRNDLANNAVVDIYLLSTILNQYLRLQTGPFTYVPSNIRFEPNFQVRYLGGFVLRLWLLVLQSDHVNIRLHTHIKVLEASRTWSLYSSQTG